jgi:undecaprenyl-phosphate 4-deoxy-4-formamido-L-arabinose transferase
VLGGVLCVFGMMMLLSVLVEHYLLGQPTPGWSSLMAVVSIFSGAQLLILGLIGEYLGRAYMTISGKPQSLVRTVIVHQPAQA